MGGDKVGANQKAFYKSLIRTADRRFKAHVDGIPKKKGK